jgi:hypothetical protein
MRDLTPQELHVTEQAAAELRDHGGLIDLTLDPATAITLVGLIRLALRHPEVAEVPIAQALGRKVAEVLEHLLSEAGLSTTDLIQRGRRG